MKIGIFTDTYTPDINGVVTSVVTLQGALEKMGHEVYIITSHKSILHAKREGNVFRMPGLEMKWLYGYVLSTPFHFKVKEEIAKLKLDVIHVQTEFGVGTFARIVARMLHIPVVYTYHTMYEDYTHYINRFDLDSVEHLSIKIFTKFTKFLCESVVAIIAPSEKTRETLVRYGIRRPIHVIPTGIDLSSFKSENVNQELREQLIKQYQLDANTKLIAYIGRVASEKSIDIIIDGFQYVKDPAIKMMVVGGGPSLEGLKKQAKQLGIDHRIIFTDKQPREHMSAYYSLADAFVSPSLSETQGMTFIEALAAGLPVFARKDEVLDELVFEGETGYYFDTPVSFANKVEAFFKLDTSNRSTFKSRCREVVKKYDVEHFGQSVLEVYEQAILGYEFYFHINAVKPSDDCMRLYLYNDKEKQEITLLISLDDYMKYEIKKNGMLEYSDYEVLVEKEKVLVTYRNCLKKLRSKDRTRKEMYDFLINEKEPLSIKQINDMIDLLEEKGYINDRAYVILQLEKMDHSLYGKDKIIRQLITRGIPYEDIVEQLDTFDETHEFEKAKKLALRFQDMIKNKSLHAKQEMMIRKLVANGFAYGLASEVIETLDFSQDIVKENVALQQTVEKAFRSYSRRYRDVILEQKVIQYALRKGFVYDDIKQVLEKRNMNGE